MNNGLIRMLREKNALTTKQLNFQAEFCICSPGTHICVARNQVIWSIFSQDRLTFRNVENFEQNITTVIHSLHSKRFSGFFCASSKFSAFSASWSNGVARSIQWTVSRNICSEDIKPHCDEMAKCHLKH